MILAGRVLESQTTVRTVLTKEAAGSRSREVLMSGELLWVFNTGTWIERSGLHKRLPLLDRTWSPETTVDVVDCGVETG